MTEDCPYCKADERNESEQKACPWHGEQIRVPDRRYLGVVRSPSERRMKAHFLRVVGPSTWSKIIGEFVECLEVME